MKGIGWPGNSLDGIGPFIVSGAFFAWGRLRAECGDLRC